MFISRIQPEVQRLLDGNPNHRLPVILTASDAHETAVKIREALGNDTRPICLTGYIHAMLKKSDMETVLSFPEVLCVSLNRQAYSA